MEIKDSIITLRLSADELQTLDAKAAAAGMDRADYIRMKLFAPNNDERLAQLEQGLREQAAGLDRLGAGLERVDKIMVEVLSRYARSDTPR